MRPPATRPGPARAPVGNIRIIGGRWRGTRLPVPDRPGLRPSSDRVRETLFNWLMPALPGARVLDLFAGTGVLGLEALSRGAAHATLVERDPGLARALDEAVARLSARENAVVQAQDALAWLGRAGAGFDIVFLDPPFADGLWEQAVAGLPAHLAPSAWLYLESPLEITPSLPPDWALHREGRTREVRFALYRAPSSRAADTLNGDASMAVPE